MKDERQVADIPIKRDYTSGSKPVMARLPSREGGTRQAGAREVYSRQAMDNSQSWNGFQSWNAYQGGQRSQPRGRFYSMW